MDTLRVEEQGGHYGEKLLGTVYVAVANQRDCSFSERNRWLSPWNVHGKGQTVGYREGIYFQRSAQYERRVGSYSLQKDGPALWFCDATLIGVDLYRPSSLREIMNTFKDWKSAYGEPLVLPKTYFREGTQISQILFKWLGEDNIERRILMAQFDQTQTGMAFSYSYIKHPCNKGPG